MASFSTIDFKNKRALVRVDFNVPLNEDKQVTDDSRIVAALPTIKAILERGGSVVLISHLGRPGGNVDLKYSLLPVANYLNQIIDNEVFFAENCVGEKIYDLSKSLKPGQVLMLENLRFHPEETSGDGDFASQLSKLGDVYINDAFGTAHRAHASTAIIAEKFDKKDRAFGLLMGAEVESLNKALLEGKKPVTAVIGGAKVSSKIDVLTSLISKVDNIIIGGGMAYTFVKAKGGNVGSSLVEDDKLSVASGLLEDAKRRGVNIYLPIDSVNATAFKDTTPSTVTPIEQIPAGEMGLDVGDKTLAMLEAVLKKSKTIIWNGPMGVFEFVNYEKGTRKIGDFIVEATKNGSFSLIGGGDSVAAAKKFGIDKMVSYVSTGGGAMLEFLEGKELPGIAAMNRD